MGLLENAIDHNRVDGSVELSASVDCEQLRIEIRDTGPKESPPNICQGFLSRFIASASRAICPAIWDWAFIWSKPTSTP